MKKIIAYLMIFTGVLLSQYSHAQDVSINVTNTPSIALGSSTPILVSVCNEDPNPIDAPANKLRPQLSAPNNVIFTAVTNTDGSPLTGWTILTQNTTTVRLLNLNPLINGECIEFYVWAQGTVVSGATSFNGTLGFNGPQTAGNTIANDNSISSIAVTAAPTPPTATPNPISTPINTSVIIPALANDVTGSAAIDPTSVMLITPLTGVPVTTLTVPGEGTYTVNPDGTVTFVPLPTFTGVATPVNYTVEDVNNVISNQAPITVTVEGPPTAVNDNPAPNPPGLPLIIAVLGNDTPGTSAINPASVQLIDPVTGLPVPTVTIPNVGTYSVNLDGTITFTPDPALTTATPTTVNYIVNGTNGLTSNQATITLNATPLPVTLVSFTAKKEGTVAILNWATTMETNSDHFEIQRSLSGKEWSKIGSVDSHRESTVKQTYTFTDKNPLQGENLYRLKMIDRDATYAYSRIQSVKFEGAGAPVAGIPSVSIYPNPSSDKVFLKDADLAQVKQASILDMTGRAVFSSSKVDSSGINVSKLTSGSYILHVTNINGTSSSHKIVIVR